MKRIITILLLMLTGSISAKNKLTTEQLLNEIEHATNDSIRCRNYHQLTKNYLRISEDSCKLFGKLALEYALKTGNKKVEAETYSVLGAREKYNGNYNESIKLHLKALAIKEANKDTLGMGITCNDIGIVYKNMDRFKEALPYYKKSNEYSRISGNWQGASMTYSNIGTIFSALKQVDSAKWYYNTALKVAKEINDTGCLVNALANLGEYYANQGDATQAKSYFEQSLVIDRASGDNYGLVLDCINLGNLALGANQLKQAAAYFDEAEMVCKEEKLNKELIGALSGQFSLHKKLGNYEKAIAYLQQAQNVKDSILNEETNQQVSELNTRYETVKKEKTIGEQQSKIQRQRYLFGSVFVLLGLIALIAYYRYKKLKVEDEIKLKQTILEQQEITTKSVLEAEEKERQRIASELHDGVGQLMTAAKMNLGALEHELNLDSEKKKTAYQKIMDLITESGKEVRKVSHNLMPNVLLKKGLSNAVQEFLNKIDARVIKVNLHAEGIQDKIDANTKAVLYRVIQECVNNVIKHSKASQLDININNDSDGVSVSIEDNGVGFDVHSVKDQGLGLGNMKTRIEYLKGSIDIDSSPGKVTLVAIFVPNS